MRYLFVSIMGMTVAACAPVEPIHVAWPIAISTTECKDQYANNVVAPSGTEFFLNCWGHPTLKKMALTAEQDLIPDGTPFAVVVVTQCDKPLRIVGISAEGDIYAMPANGIPDGVLQKQLKKVAADHIAYVPIPGPCDAKKPQKMPPPPRGGANL